MRWAPHEEISDELIAQLHELLNADWRTQNVRSVVSLDPDSHVYVRCSRWRRYTADGRFSKLTGQG